MIRTRGPTALLLAICLAVIAAFADAPATSAQPASTTDGSDRSQAQKYVDASSLTDTLYTFNSRTKQRGTMVSTTTWNISNQASGGKEAMLKPSPSSLPTPLYDGGSGGTAKASGCRSLSLNMQKKTVSGLGTLYHAILVVNWCWYLVTVYNYSVSVQVPHVDGLVAYHGIVGSSDRWYAWYKPVAKSGRQTYRLLHFQQCVWLICTTNWHPWAKLNSHADGTYYWQRDNW